MPDVGDGDANAQRPKGKVGYLVDCDHVAARGNEHDRVRRQQIEYVRWGLWRHAGKAVPISVFVSHRCFRASRMMVIGSLPARDSRNDPHFSILINRLRKTEQRAAPIDERVKGGIELAVS